MANAKNPFYDDEIDDDTFLRSGRGQRGQQGQDPSEVRRQQLLQRRREIEERTIDSSQRSIGLLYESEKVGQATAEELHHQKEQLKATEQRLDDINSTLKQSERHLTGIKSVFGGIRNYFSGRSQTSGVPPQSQPGGPRMPSAGASPGFSSAQYGIKSGIGAEPDYSSSSHPGLRVRGLGEDRLGGASGSAADDILDRNLEEMSHGLSRLKGLAKDLNQELDEHNEILDRLDDKTANTHWKVEKQNKDMGKLLGGKK